MKTTITSKGQVTIPVAIRKKLKLDAGTVLDFDEDADHLRAAVVVARQVPIRQLIGTGKDRIGKKSSLQWLDEMRGPVELPRARRKK